MASLLASWPSLVKYQIVAYELVKYQIAAYKWLKYTCPGGVGGIGGVGEVGWVAIQW